MEELPLSARELDQVLFIPLPLDLRERRTRSVFGSDEFCNLRIRSSIEDVHRDIPIKESDILEVFLILAHDECAGEGGWHEGLVGRNPSTDSSYKRAEAGEALHAKTGFEAEERVRRSGSTVKPNMCTTMRVSCIQPLIAGRVTTFPRSYLTVLGQNAIEPLRSNKLRFKHGANQNQSGSVVATVPSSPVPVVPTHSEAEAKAAAAAAASHSSRASRTHPWTRATVVFFVASHNGILIDELRGQGVSP